MAWTAKSMVYFAYGSNLCLPRLLGRVKSARFIEIAKVEGLCLEFYKRSEGKFGASAKATMVPREGSAIYGALYFFDENDIGGLRDAEGYPDHYGEEMITVISLSGAKEAMTYVAKKEYYDESQVPYDWYVDLIRFGGRRLGLPEDYISRFDYVETKPDPNGERAKRERAYLR